MKNNIKVTLLIIFSCIGLWYVMHYTAPIHTPQYVNFDSAPKINSGSLIIDSKLTIGQWEIRPIEPKNFLMGFNSFLFSFDTNESDTYYPPPIVDIDFRKTSLKNFPAEVPAIAMINLIQYNGRFYGFENDFYNNKTIAAQCNDNNILEGSILIEKFDERFKGITFKGKISLTAKMFPEPDSCEGEPLLLEIKDLEFDIDSELIYEWSNKGGDTYRI